MWLKQSWLDAKLNWFLEDEKVHKDDQIFWFAYIYYIVFDTVTTFQLYSWPNYSQFWAIISMLFQS